MPAILGLAGALEAQKSDEDVLALYDRARTLRPNSVTVMVRSRGALRAADRHAEALALLEQAIALRPRFAGAWGGLGATKEELGDMEGARAAFREAIRLAPRQPGLYAGLFNATKLTAGDPLIEALDALGQDGRPLPSSNRSSACSLSARPMTISVKRPARSSA